MKKKIFTLLALFACVLSASAQNTLTVGEALITKGGTGSFDVVLTNPGDAFCAFQMDLTLPDGFTLESLTKSGRFGAQGLKFSDQGSGLYRIVSAMDDENNPYLGEDGALFSVTVSADASLVVGNKYSATISNVEFTRKAETTFKPADFSFDLEVTDKVILDENSLSLPAAQTGANVLVKRTLIAGVWNTLCLPFEMTIEQVKEKFGDGVKLAELDSDNAPYTSSGNSFTVSFIESDMTDKFYANWPYIVKPTKDVTSFTLESVDVAPNEDAATQDWKRKVGKVNETYAKFIGTLKAGTVLDADNLFISNNKFYYSTGTTAIKGFRGYFYFKDFDSSAAAPEFVVNGNPTKIEGIQIITDDGQLYNLKGQKIDNPTQKGVYIQNGKKVVVK